MYIKELDEIVVGIQSIVQDWGKIEKLIRIVEKINWKV